MEAVDWPEEFTKGFYAGSAGVKTYNNIPNQGGRLNEKNSF